LAYSVSREPFAIRFGVKIGKAAAFAFGLPMANGECKEEKKKVL